MFVPCQSLSPREAILATLAFVTSPSTHFGESDDSERQNSTSRPGDASKPGKRPKPGRPPPAHKKVKLISDPVPAKRPKGAG